MSAFRLRPLPLFTLALLLAAPVAAQEVVQPLPGTTDADALAADMRRIATNPRDVDALVDAARLSLRLDDIRAAGALLQRAENVEPRNPRVKAGQASVLLQSERPGQALRYFAEAEAAGLNPSTFAADRGLAYDLTGQQARAQLDYARALRDQPNDAELIRRYALSLGISGQRQRALQMLDPLVRRSDRAAWRTQAFVLAMTGDVGGASRIAATMMPGGAAGLSAFFERLPTLSPTDRAFAVHFGEVRPTPERLADARLAPPVAPLPTQSVVLASAQPVALPQTARIQPVRNQTGRNRRDRERAPAADTPPTSAAVIAPARRETSQQVASATPARTPATSAPIPVTVRSLPPAGTGAIPAASGGISGSVLAAAREPAVTVGNAAPPVQIASASTLPALRPSAPSVVPAASQAPVQLAAVAPSSVPTARGGPDPAPATVPMVRPAEPTVTAAVEPAPAALATATAPVRPVAGTRASEDSILARIIAGLSIPGSELGVSEPPRPTAPAVVIPAAPPPVVGRAEPVAKVEAPVKAEPSAAEKAAADKLAAARAVADKKAADRKAAAEKKALAEKKAAAAAKALADKEAAEQKRIARANPERIWVQVAGGAYEGDLPKAYAAVKAKAPGVFGSRGGYTTPLRATNRVLTGPFKTDAEARQFVNDLKKEGVSAFTFTSDPGQPVSRLGAKGKAADDEPEAKGKAEAKSSAKKADTTAAKAKRRR